MIGLREIRKKRRLNQQKVAIDLNISRESLSYYENGKREPSLSLLVEMSRYFNVSINYLITGKEFEKRLDSVYITVNKNAIPNDPETPFVTSGVRVGTPAATSRGFKEEDFIKVAHLMKLAATDIENKADYIRSEVCALCEKYPIYR